MSDAAGLRNWCITSYDLDNFKVPLNNNHFIYCVHQLEKCPQTGKIHIQAYAEFARTMRMALIKKLFNDNTMHLEPRQGTREQARNYCMKEDTRVPGTQPTTFGEWRADPSQSTRLDLVKALKIIQETPKYDDLWRNPDMQSVLVRYPEWVQKHHSMNPIDYSLPLVLYEWQTILCDLFDGPVESRRIFWIWSKKPNTGKTTFYTYCSFRYNVLPAKHRSLDVLHAYNDQQIIWFAYTRNSRINYDQLEDYSDIGWKLSTKFHSVRKFMRAHIVVTANCPPDETKIPERCHIVNLDE